MKTKIPNKEKIFVSRNNEVASSPSKYIGVEVAIGNLDQKFINELERIALIDNKLWQREETGYINIDTNAKEYLLCSSFLNEAFKYNDIYHKEGLLFNEEIDHYHIDERYGKDIDRYSESTDNWILDPAGSLGTHSYPDIPKTGNVILSIRMQDFHFRSHGDFDVSLKQSPDCDSIYNPLTGKFEKVEDKFIIRPFIDTFSSIFNLGENYLIHPFSILYDVKLIGGSLYNDDEYLIDLQKEINNDPLWYYSVHVIYKDSKIIGWLTSYNHPFNEDSSFPFFINKNINVRPDLMYCISPCPQRNIKFSSWDNYDDYIKMQSFIFQDINAGQSRSNGIPANERSDEYRKTIKNLISLLSC